MPFSHIPGVIALRAASWHCLQAMRGDSLEVEQNEERGRWVVPRGREPCQWLGASPKGQAGCQKLKQPKCLSAYR